MAPIMTITPEFWTDAKITKLSLPARLLFIGMWNFCDDAGRHTASPRQLKSEVFPADKFSESAISKMIDELAKAGLLTLFGTPDGREYYQAVGWRHQKINRPQESRFSSGIQRFHGVFTERSVNVHGAFTPDRNGREGIGMEGNGRDTGSSFTECSVNEPAELVFPCHGEPESWDLDAIHDRLLVQVIPDRRYPG